jgi:hypothetical protein
LPSKVPEKENFSERLDSVLNVIYLIYNESYSAYDGQSLSRNDLAEEAIRLARLLCELIPQASAIYNLYAKEDVQVIGLHTVYEHHEVMTVDALKVFVSEYKIAFPIAVDKPLESGLIPNTMASYQMRGTPTLIVLDKESRVRLNYFGRISDMQVGNLIGSLLAEDSGLLSSDTDSESNNHSNLEKCGDDSCSI